MSWKNTLKSYYKESPESLYRDDPDTFIARVVSTANWEKPNLRLNHEKLDDFKQRYTTIKQLHEELLSDLKAEGLQ